jgi:hypothetical protein
VQQLVTRIATWGLGAAVVLALAGCDEICIDGACFQPDPDAELDVALWLDWTNIPTPTNWGWSTYQWNDRSLYANHATAVDAPVPMQIVGETNVFHLHSGNAFTVAQEEDDPLWSLEEGDYTILLATSLDCFPGEPAYGSHELFAKMRPATSPTNGPSGMLMMVYGPEPDADRELNPVISSCDPYHSGCVTGAHYQDTTIACDTYQIVAMRRFTVDGQGFYEARVDGVSMGPLPAPDHALVGGAVLQFGYDMSARLAAAIAIKGNVDDAQLCELEQFMLERLVGAGLRDDAPDLGCD